MVEFYNYSLKAINYSFKIYKLIYGLRSCLEIMNVQMWHITKEATWNKGLAFAVEIKRNLSHNNTFARWKTSLMEKVDHNDVITT